MENRRKELIIQSICSMDTKMLEVLLDESRTYQDTYKDVFIKKLYFAFFCLKTSGSDTELIPYKGYCNHDECACKGCEGISFVGNNSQIHIDLLFIEDDEDSQNEIVQCKGFKTFEEIEIGDKTFHYPIYIEEHERADFKPSLDFLIQQQKCQLAYGELNLHEERIVEVDILATWLEKHQELFESIDKGNKHPDFEHFRELFSTFSAVISYSKYGPVARRALNEYSAIYPNDEANLLKWLVKYKKLGRDLFPEVCIKDNFITVYSLRMDSENLRDLVEFVSIYEEHYSALTDKLDTLYPELFRF